MTDPRETPERQEDRLQAVETALIVHDGMQRLIREDGMPKEAVEPAAGFLAALESGGFTVAALEVTESPDGLDVERLARAMHAGSHHYRGGADDDLARMACTQFGWEQSGCLAKARSLAARYAALAPATEGAET